MLICPIIWTAAPMESAPKPLPMRPIIEALEVEGTASAASNGKLASVCKSSSNSEVPENDLEPVAIGVFGQRAPGSGFSDAGQFRITTPRASDVRQ